METQLKKIMPFVLLALLAIGTIGAGIILSENYFGIVNSLACKSTNWVWLPQSVGTIFEGKKIGLHFLLVNGKTVDEWGTVKNARIQNMQCTKPSNIDFDVTMDDRTAIELATSQKPITSFVTAWKTGKINVVAHGKENEQLLAYANQLMAQDTEAVPDNIRNVIGQYRK